MIAELTQEQKDQMQPWADKWIKIGTSTDSTTDDQFRECFEATKAIYQSIDGESPDNYIVVDSPIQIYNITGDKDFTSKSYCGNFESGWLSYYTYFKDVVGIQLTPILEHFVTISKYASYCYIHDKTVIFSRKPTQVIMQNGLLHNESGPSILFADGFSVYSINGHRVSEQIVMRPETLTIKQIENESNSDIQSIMLDRFGWERYIDECGAVAIDSRQNDVENTLEILYDTTKFGRRLVCTCPTGRVFVKGIETRDDTKTCEGAQNWLSGYTDANRKFRTVGRT